MDSVSLHCNAMAPVRPVLGCALADRVVQAQIWLACRNSGLVNLASCHPRDRGLSYVVVCVCVDAGQGRLRRRIMTPCPDQSTRARGGDGGQGGQRRSAAVMEGTE